MKEIEIYESHGFRLFPLRGKKPIVNEWQKTAYKQNQFTKGFKGNFGVNLQETDLVIDVDPRGFKESDRPHNRLAKIVPEMKKTLVVETGGGGLHIYFTMPPDIKIRKNVNDYQGIDFLSQGRYVVGAGSIHPESKKPYKIVSGSFDDVLPAPLALLDIVEARTPERALHFREVYDDSESTQLRFIEYLKISAPLAKEGQGGNNTTFKVACRGRDFGLSRDSTLALMFTWWNSRCEPAWAYDELGAVVTNAYKFNQDPAGKFHPSNQFEPLVLTEAEKKNLEEGETWRAETEVETEPDFIWHLNKQGEWQRNSIHNVCNFFNGYVQTTDLDKLLRFNTLSQNIEFTRRPFWIHKNEPLTAWDDNDANAVMKFLSTKLAFNATKNLIHDTALAVAQENKYNPVVQYLESHTWDGVPRIHNWLTTYVRVDETAYTNAVGKLMLKAAIRRAYDSGCKYDYMVVLEGEQGIGKSTICEILGQEWYADLILNVHSPDTVDCMRNKWIIEVSEMECTKRADTQALKSFLTRRTDTVRLAYARTSKDFPRHNIFIGTFNPDVVGSYLKDMTGNRRYLPIAVEGTKFLDFKAFQKDVGQVWAEALVEYKKNPYDPLYLTDKVVFEQARIETVNRRDVDSWVDTIADWLENPDGSGVPKEAVSATEVWTHALGGDRDKLGNVQFRRIANVMAKELNWEKKTQRVNGVQKRVYVRSSTLVDKL